MKKFGNLVWRSLFFFLPLVLVLLYVIDGTISSIIALAVGMVSGLSFEEDWAKLKASYREFRNQKDDSNDESS